MCRLNYNIIIIKKTSAITAKQQAVRQCDDHCETAGSAAITVEVRRVMCGACAVPFRAMLHKTCAALYIHYNSIHVYIKLD